MSISNKNLVQAGLSGQSGVRSNNFRIKQWSSAGLLACLFILLFGGVAGAQNVLINPGAETGDFTGWNLSGGAGYKFVVSTNQYIPNSAPSNYLAHSGKYTFELFDTTADSSYIWQDFPAIAGSQWSSSVYAISYASNYIGGAAGSGSVADLQVVFFDTNDNVVPYPPSSYGVFGSQILDPDTNNITVGVTWATIPPMAVDATGWVYLQPTNLFSAYPATEGNYDSTGYPTTLTAPPGTAYVRFLLEYDNSSPPAGAPVYFDDCVLNKVLASDPDISVNPVAASVFAGLPASFSVTATHTGAHPTEKFHYQWFFNKTNLLTAGMNNISSPNTTTATLNFTNLQGSASGLYDCVVTLTASDGYSNAIRSVPVPLTVQVLDPIQRVNLLGANAGFENGGVNSFAPFLPFNGCYFAGPLSANPNYGATTDPVVPYAGNWCCLVGANGDPDNGFHCSVPVTPGEVLKAGGYAFIASTNDFAGSNTCRMQIWFLLANGNPSTNDLLYESFTAYGLDYTNPSATYSNMDVSSPNYGQIMLHPQMTRDQWCYLGATNVTTQYFTSASPYAQGNDWVTNTLPNGYFVVPPDAAAINYQVYLNVPAADGIATDAIYWDEMRLIQVTPVTDLKATASGGTVNLTFSAGAAQIYTVFYKTNLTDAVWNVLSSNVAAPMSWQTNTASVGVTYPVTVTDVPNGHTRFYRVSSN
jgi:hypothetical protein